MSNLPLPFLLHLFLLPHLLRAAPRPPFSLSEQPHSAAVDGGCAPPPSRTASSLPLRATPWPSRATTGMATVAAAAGAARPPRLPPHVHRTRVDRAYTRQPHPPSLDLFIPHAPCQSCGAIDGLHVKLATRLSPPLLRPYKERPRTPLCSLRLPRPPELPPAPQRPHLPPRPPLMTGF